MRKLCFVTKAGLGVGIVIGVAGGCSSTTPATTVVVNTEADAGSAPDVSVASGAAKVDVAAVDFGQADCGGAAPEAKMVTLSNAGGGALTWSATIDNAAFAIQGGASGEIAAGKSATITVSASAIPSATNAGTITSAMLAITTGDASNALFDLPVTITASGATLQVTRAWSTSGSRA